MTVFSLVVTLGVLFGLNELTELAEREGLVDTQSAEHPLAVREEPLFAPEGQYWVAASHRPGARSRPRFPIDRGDKWRMFILGGSFSVGTPYGFSPEGVETFGSIAAWLNAAMEPRYDSRTRVISGALGGSNSARVLSVAQEVVQLGADALLVATGNNEGALSPGMVRSQLRTLGGYRLLARLLQPEPGLEQQVMFTPQDPDTEAITKEYREHLDGIVQSAGQAGVHVFLAAMPVNLRYSGPALGHALDATVKVGSEGRCGELHGPVVPGELEDLLEFLRRCPGLEDVKSWIGITLMRLGRRSEGIAELSPFWGECVARGVGMHLDGNHVGAIEQLQGCDNTAEALRWIGLARYELRDFRGAIAALEQATELMPRNRTRPSFNVYVRQLAAKFEHVTLVDLDAAARRASPGGVPGEELFLDYCHMNWWGYRVMAEEVLRVIEGSRAGPGPPTGPEPTWDQIAQDHDLPPLH